MLPGDGFSEVREEVKKKIDRYIIFGGQMVALCGIRFRTVSYARRGAALLCVLLFFKGPRHAWMTRGDLVGGGTQGGFFVFFPGG